jgi:hypothetical protein
MCKLSPNQIVFSYLLTSLLSLTHVHPYRY